MQFGFKKHKIIAAQYISNQFSIKIDLDIILSVKNYLFSIFCNNFSFNIQSLRVLINHLEKFRKKMIINKTYIFFGSTITPSNVLGKKNTMIDEGSTHVTHAYIRVRN